MENLARHVVVGDFTLYSFKKKRIPVDYKSFIYAADVNEPSILLKRKLLVLEQRLVIETT